MKRRGQKRHPEFDFDGARGGRDDGFDAVLGNSPEDWKRNYERLMGLQEVQEPFTGEAFRVYAIPKIGHPHHHNAWGAMWNVALRKGWILPTGQYCNMGTKKSHARKTELYNWS